MPEPPPVTRITLFSNSLAMIPPNNWCTVNYDFLRFLLLTRRFKQGSAVILAAAVEYVLERSSPRYGGGSILCCMHVRILKLFFTERGLRWLFYERPEYAVLGGLCPPTFESSVRCLCIL